MKTPYRLAIPALAPIFLLGADLTIDHVTAAGARLADLQEKLAAAGIRSEPGGAHGNRATEMAIVSFRDGSYLELIARQANADPQAVAAHPWGEFIELNGGPCAWAVRAPDLETAAKRLRAAGVAVSPPERAGRQRPDGKRLEWQTAQVGDGVRGSFFPFLIQDFTPRGDRVNPRGKPAAPQFSGVTKVVIAVRDLEEAVKKYREAYGYPAPLKQVDKDFDAHLAMLGGGPVVLAAPLSSHSWLAERLEKFGEAPCAFVLGAGKRGRYRTASKSRWFGKDVNWIDPEKLGWRLGIE
ncbi:MAG TPA: VOC family protein [Bryobacteraceae bacterium]|nr:VOC family protein [Bryobacteraceae bacterium]